MSSSSTVFGTVCSSSFTNVNKWYTILSQFPKLLEFYVNFSHYTAVKGKCLLLINFQSISVIYLHSLDIVLSEYQASHTSSLPCRADH